MRGCATRVDDAKIEAVDQAAVATLLAEVREPRPGPLTIGDDGVTDAFAHGRPPHVFPISQCEMPARKPTRPETAITAQRTPRACNRMACISSTLRETLASSASMWETFCSTMARRSLVFSGAVMAAPRLRETRRRADARLR